MNNSLVFVSLVSLLYSCHNVKPQDSKEVNLIRPVYHPYSLGMPMMDAIRHDMIYQLAAKSPSQENELSMHKTALGKKYYARPIIVAGDTDTALYGLRVVYSMKQGELKDAAKQDVMFVMDNNTNVFDTEIRDDVIAKVSAKYGSPDDVDTVSAIEPTGLHIRYSWVNRNDVDVRLDYKAQNRLMIGDFVYYYSIALDYRYTEAMLKKINYSSSRY
ncbi:MAG: hypothetical protein EOO08_12195 [Chitinophagaceae bacterium]|nr:MAG: hypothetical protein EOO08_12195 [Chitinophagaceae bacterium]